jgi:hypothetical protein
VAGILLTILSTSSSELPHAGVIERPLRFFSRK